MIPVTRKPATSVWMIGLMVGMMTGINSDKVLADAAELFETVCADCHGDNIQRKDDIGAPPLAGGSRYYLASQLEKFRSGQRGGEKAIPQAQMMAPIAMDMTDADIEGMALFLSGSPASDKTDCPPGDERVGLALVPICTSCHGEEFEGVEALKSPRLNHLPATYIARQIKAFKNGQRGMHPLDETGQQMASMASLLADDQSVFDVLAAIRMRMNDTSCTQNQTRK